MGDPEAGQTCAHEHDAELVGNSNQAFQRQQAATPPYPDLGCFFAGEDRTLANEFDAPGLKQHGDGLAWLKDKTYGAWPYPLSLAAQDVADAVHIHGVQLQLVGRHGHGSADLQEAAHPAVRQIYLGFMVLLIMAGLHFETI